MAQYVAQLDALAAAIDRPRGDGAHLASALLAQLPPAWRITASGRTFDVPLAPLRLASRDWTTNRDASARRRLRDHIRMLRLEAASFERPAPDRAAQRALLADILSKPDFADLHGPTWLDRLRQRLLQTLANWLGHAMPSSVIPTIGGVLVYALIAIAMVVAWRRVRGYLTFRESAAAHVPIGAPAARGWAQWLAEARSAAALGDWRDAVHLTYWCAIAFLEDRGAWRPDRARTPREYLRLLPSTTEHGATLAALTQRFERIWYGSAVADAQAYADSIEQLKHIGCPVA